MEVHKRVNQIVEEFGCREMIEVPPDLRFSIWEVFLKVMPKVDDYDIYREERDMLAKAYNTLREQLLRPPLNPLDNRVRKLRFSIEKDVLRTYQEFPLFCQTKTQQKLTNVLLVWSLNNEVGYRQGMNELVGVLLHVSPNASEHELYYLFRAIMDLLGHYTMFNTDMKDNPLLRRILRLYNVTLKKNDFELFRYLTINAFQPEVFLIRWIKCLLAREFDVTAQQLFPKVPTTLVLWDHMFIEFYRTQKPGIGLLDRLIIGILMLAKPKLYEQETSFEMIRYLLNIQKVDVQQLLALAYKASDEDDGPTEGDHLDFGANQTSAFVDLAQSLAQRPIPPTQPTLSILDIFESFNITTGLVKLSFLYLKKSPKQPTELHQIQ